MEIMNRYNNDEIYTQTIKKILPIKNIRRIQLSEKDIIFVIHRARRKYRGHRINIGSLCP